ncbi:glutathione S-transferase family protein [Devosia sp.]|uniref:glutathione S-transferase family protein n=1 Tax=Devosia sp. TaxID=1871048 RepID=UPI003A90C0C9
MTIRLLGRRNSCNVQKVMWMLDELELDHDHVEIGGAFGGNDSAAFLSLNPNGTVPVLKDGGLTLWESHAILRYLAAQYGSGRFWPEDPVDRAVVDQWTDWTATTFQPAWIALFWQVVRTPAPQHDAEAIAAALHRTYRSFEIMDTRLASSPWLAGDAFSIADIAAGAALYRWSSMEIDRPELPHVEAWHERLSERRAFREAVCRSFEELRGRTAY